MGGKKCCVPGCRSNYVPQDEYISVFKFPKEDRRKQQWVQKIHRENFQPSNSSVVCIKHFTETFIEREVIILKKDGSIASFPKARPTLKNNAFPSIFPNQPSYLSTAVLSTSRKLPQERAKERLDAENASLMDSFSKDDIIPSLDEMQSKVNDKIDSKVWHFACSSDCINIFKVVFNEFSEVTVRVNIDSKLCVKIWFKNYLLPKAKYSWILGQDGLCNRWSKFENILSHFNSYENNSYTEDDRLSYALKLLNEFMEAKMPESKTFKFIIDQIKIMQFKTPHYSPETILWSCMLFYSSPTSYKLLRNSQMLTIPHPSYLKKLSFNSDMLNSGMSHSHLNYLQKKIASMTEDEKLVNLLLDEIHIKPCLSYKSGNVHGLAENVDAPATSLQAFMITSLKSKNKDIVALYPVKNLNGDTLFNLIKTVLEKLHTLGFKVVALISDNRINRNAFEKFCNGSLKECIQHPFDPDLKLFFLFDSVHLIKCIRNNWLNVKQPIQTFVFPPFSNDTGNILEAPLKVIKNLYDMEKNNINKYAKDLSQKVLYPSSFERQNVQFVMKLFNLENIAALKTLKLKDYEPVCVFMDIIVKWWNIVNVKSKLKGICKRNSFCDPINSTSNSNLIFLVEFSKWIQNWETMESETKKRCGKLSKETSFALKHTTSTLVKLCDYLLDSQGFEYVLLGKFQTDPLEARFGQYRQMSGANYNISVPQVLESEKKIKLLNLLSLNSKFGKFTIKDLKCDFGVDENALNVHSVNLSAFESVLDTMNYYEINEYDSDVLNFISGYVSHTVSNRVNCTMCSYRLCLDKNLEIDPSSLSQYFMYLDRGGLKLPSQFTLTVCSVTYKIFQCILKEHEDAFIRTEYQRNILIMLGLRAIDSEETFEYCPNCEISTKQLHKLCIRTMSNILLNNYTKLYNNNYLESDDRKKRMKLSTLNS